MISNRVKVLDIKSDFSSSQEALSKVLNEMEVCKLNKVIRVLLIIHGYGSSGKGGKIKRELLLLLPTLKKQNKILDFIPNEKFIQGSDRYKTYTTLYPELILDNNLSNLNPGITLIFLN